MQTTTTHRGAAAERTVSMTSIPVFSITVFTGREITDREQLPARAFSYDEAEGFAEQMRAAHGATHFRVRRTDLKAAA